MLRLSELYSSVQGEGPNVGLPTQFVRFAGCNLRCPGWPCDTPHAIEPSIWRNESKQYTASELLNLVPTYPRNLCLTGGEPLIQPNVELQEFCELAWLRGHTIEMFTNGTKKLPLWGYGKIRYMMDYKLAGSGETFDEKTRAQRHDNMRNLNRQDGIKFVAKDVADLNEARLVWELATQESAIISQFWVASAWDTLDTQSVIDFVQDNRLPWRLNVQLHKYIWPADARAV